MLAALSCALVPPDRHYVEYVDWRTLTSLYCILAVVRALELVHVPTMLAEHVVRLLPTRRRLVLGLVGVTLATSAVITNDMALLALLPLSWVTLRATGNEEHLALVFVLQAAAANLGGMITPFGSPQNLYLYQYFHIGIGEFLRVMVVPFAVSVVLLAGLCLLVPSGPLVRVAVTTRVRPWPALLHVALFLVVVAIVLRALPTWTGLVVVAVLLLTDHRALARVDHGLVLTFLAFFVVAGNATRLPVVAEALRDLLSTNTLLASALGSQVVSNVPAAILAAPFVEDHHQLLVGVNVGGVGTIVASLASLIALRLHDEYRPGRTAAYLRLFTVVNIGLLVVLLATMQAAAAAGLL